MGMFERVITRIGSWGTVIGAVFMSAVALIITATVLWRAFGRAIPGTYDLVETLIVVGIAFALVYGQIEDRHLRAEIAIERLHGRVRAGIESFLGVLNIFYWAVLLWAATDMMIEKWSAGEQTQIMKVSIVPFRGVWVFAVILILILLSIKLIHHIKRLIKEGAEK